MAKQSIMQTERECYVTRSTAGLDLHHVYAGKNRQASDRNGFVVYLRHDVHMALHEHRHPFERLDAELRRECQRTFEAQGHSRAEFMAIIGASYLD